MDPLFLQCRLNGAKIFLSASIPSARRGGEFERIADAPLRIEEAIVCLARAIFMEGGTLVFGGHPAISPLIARVVEDYYLPAPAEKIKERGTVESLDLQWQNPSVMIYQSQVWKRHLTAATKRLVLNPAVTMRWIPGSRGENVDPEIMDRPQSPKSVRKMRESMIRETAPVAMIAIGGMEGVLDEARLFAQLCPGQPIYSLATTGGAASILQNQEDLTDVVLVEDRDAESLVRSFWETQELSKASDPSGKNERRNTLESGDQRVYYVPYAYITQQIVRRIIDDRARPHGQAN